MVKSDDGWVDPLTAEEKVARRAAMLAHYRAHGIVPSPHDATLPWWCVDLQYQMGEGDQDPELVGTAPWTPERVAESRLAMPEDWEIWDAQVGRGREAANAAG